MNPYTDWTSFFGGFGEDSSIHSQLGGGLRKEEPVNDRIVDESIDAFVHGRHPTRDFEENLEEAVIEENEGKDATLPGPVAFEAGVNVNQMRSDFSPKRIEEIQKVLDLKRISTLGGGPSGFDINMCLKAALFSEMVYFDKNSMVPSGFSIERIVDPITNLKAAVCSNMEGETWVVFSGTDFSDPAQVNVDLDVYQTNFQSLHDIRIHGKVHNGFYRACTAIVHKIIPLLPDTSPVWATGHSMGAAISTIFAAIFYKCTGVIGFGSPKVFDYNGALTYSIVYANQHYRVENSYDPVCRVPTLPYYHVNQLVHIYHNKNHDGLEDKVGADDILKFFQRELEPYVEKVGLGIFGNSVFGPQIMEPAHKVSQISSGLGPFIAGAIGSAVAGSAGEITGEVAYNLVESCMDQHKIKTYIENIEREVRREKNTQGSKEERYML